MIFSLSLFNIQHVKELHFEIDLAKNNLTCIVEKNSVGKTTLVRAIANFKSADIFQKTASPYIFNANSKVTYEIDGERYEFSYNKNTQTIDLKSIINDEYKNNIEVELPIPYGLRFSHFQTLGKIDNDLRTAISLEDYVTPNELITFLSKIYGSDRFKNLKEITIKNKKYYFILKDNSYYIREDYLSSGEYFVIHLYKLIHEKKKLIAIDEIDISLDASAQVRLLKELREFCKNYEVNILFTTQSLALMKSFSNLGEEKLHYLENKNGIISIDTKSYNYIKSILYGFKGWDQYILTEDIMLKNYLEHLLSNEPITVKYKVIYIAGGSNVVDLMDRNEEEEFFASSAHVICVLDGDQKNENYCKEKDKVYFIPFESVEKQLEEHYINDEFDFVASIDENSRRQHKARYKVIQREGLMTDIDIFSCINRGKQVEVDLFKRKLIEFLS